MEVALVVLTGALGVCVGAIGTVAAACVALHRTMFPR